MFFICVRCGVDDVLVFFSGSNQTPTTGTGSDHMYHMPLMCYSSSTIAPTNMQVDKGGTGSQLGDNSDQYYSSFVAASSLKHAMTSYVILIDGLGY